MVAASLLAAAIVVGGAPAAEATPTSAETALLNATNSYRQSKGLPSLQNDPAVSSIARSWALRMARAGTLSHNPSLTQLVTSRITPQWTCIGENVGFGPKVKEIRSAFTSSRLDEANVLGRYDRVGIGVVADSSGRLWATVDFVRTRPRSRPCTPSS
jgi:uncharacterized protein YkwD